MGFDASCQVTVGVSTLPGMQGASARLLSPGFFVPRGYDPSPGSGNGYQPTPYPAPYQSSASYGGAA